MRVSRALAVLVCVALPAVGHADTTRVVVMTAADPLQAALRVTLAGRGADVAVLPAPTGVLRLERAAVAQQTVRGNNAEAGVWIDADDDNGGVEVCVVSADGRFFRHAPLPDASPRMFAAIATSLLDELFSPPEFPVNVDVHVDVGGPPMVAPPAMLPTAPLLSASGTPSSRLSAMPMVASLGTAQTVPVVDTAWAHRPVIEIGPTLSPVSAGVSAEVTLPITPSFRAGVLGAASVLLGGVNDMTPGTRLFVAALEARYVGRGARHFDVGILGGAARADDLDEGGFAALRFSMVWEGAGSGVALSVSPSMLIKFRGSSDYLPSVMLSLTWELPL